MAGKRAGTLLVLMERIETFTLRRAWTRLSDDEFFWEPVAGAWGVRRRDECRTPTAFGDGDWVADFDNDLALGAMTRGEIEPMTTIGWLMWHVGSMPGRWPVAELLRRYADPVERMDVALVLQPSSPRVHHGFDAYSRRCEPAGGSGGGHAEDAEDERLEQLTCASTYAPEPPRAGLMALGPPGARRSGLLRR